MRRQAFLFSVRDYAEAGPPLARSLPISLDPELPMQRPALLSKIRAGLSFVCILLWMFRIYHGSKASGGRPLLTVSNLTQLRVAHKIVHSFEQKNRPEGLSSVFFFRIPGGDGRFVSGE